VTAPALPGAYVHVPYCAHRCSYCSFVAIAGRDGEEEYFEAVAAEVRARAGEVAGPLETVYFGGGTPSYVEPRRLATVLDALKETFGIASSAEVTAEGNPDDLTDERLEALTALGVNRLSIGVQSLDDGELPWLERRHDAAAALSALRRASRVFPSVSADLMIGIPAQTRESLLASLDGVLDAGARHLSAYLLELEKAPRLVALRTERPDLFPDDDETAERWEEVDARASAAGLPRYEMSNWASPGHESRHNLKYWRREPTLGLGVAAHSFDGVVRRANTGSTTEYVRRIRAGDPAFVSGETLEAAAAEKERVLLGLRLAEGVTAPELERVARLLPPADRARLAESEEAGLLDRADGRIRLTRRGVLLSNEVLSLLV
jgi:oxygen-independent coproporphyrinogen-3 oxidase